MKKVLLGIITVLMIIGTSSNLHSQSDTKREYQVVSACIHDSQDQHLYNTYDTDVSEPYTITVTLQDSITLLVINDPERERKYTLTGLNTARSGNKKLLYFTGIDDKGVECKVVAIIYPNNDVVICVAYPTIILYWSGVFIEEEHKIQT